MKGRNTTRVSSVCTHPRLETYQATGRLNVLMNSQVCEILSGHVRLAMTSEDSQAVPEEKTIDAQTVFVLAGAIPPYEMLKKIGVRFGGESVSREAAHAV